MRRMIQVLILIFFILGAFPMLLTAQQPITTGMLLKEMVDMERLTKFPEQPYRSIQFSSYDRRSVSPGEPGWFGNADGFGYEPIPGFEKILKEPGRNGIGEYLICDVKGPGAIVRLWTAAISGSIRFYLDGKLAYDGSADQFFWNFPAEVSKEINANDLKGVFRQYDALYFPIPFAKSCRIEWTGSLKDIHFYHVGMRLYNQSIKIKTFQPEDIKTFRTDINRAIEMIKKTEVTILPGTKKDTSLLIPKKEKRAILQLEGERAINQLKIKINTDNPDAILRQTVLRIYFDGASVPQIESPVGDFFGAAPGINPYESLPLSVSMDGTMICRFVMPFQKSALIQIENMSGQSIGITASASFQPYQWDEHKSLHLYARWRVNHNLKASNREPSDIPYLLVMGKGRLVGAACYLMNPSNVTTASGNWWGEGDEKIMVDKDKFPSFFGTGSEDYYNYSWSAEDIFYYPYCGQPRNDGPATRGFVTNFRWHILDDIPFENKLAFYMELLSHGEVPGFTYARMVYIYGKKGLIDDHTALTPDDVRPMVMPVWNPVAFRAATDYRFIEAENAFRGVGETRFEYDPLWAGGKILVWYPQQPGEKINFEVHTSAGLKDMQISFGKMINGGKIKIYVNDQPVKLKDQEIADLSEEGRMLNRAYGTNKIKFMDGRNTITLESVSGKESKIAIDLLWIKDWNPQSEITPESFTELDSSIIKYMQRADIVGMSVAIVYKERLVYRKAYGFVDSVSQRPANVNHMFRIASMSKPVTVIALSKLIEQGKLNMDQKVFGPGSILGEDFGSVPVGSMKDQITVRHLIEHTSGWAGDMAYTGYNDYPDAGAMVRAGLATYDLAFTPGEKVLYSNFGYGVLGRVIEKLSGMTYFEFVSRNIIEPCGIKQMKLAKGPLTDRDTNESNYYADDEQDDMVHPAISNYFDSFGGWISTPTDYARFVLNTDRRPGIPDILPENILNLTYFKGNWSHGGMLPGTATNITRLTDDLTMIYMANTWRFKNPAFKEMHDCVRNPIMARTSWPDYNLFEE